MNEPMADDDELVARLSLSVTRLARLLRQQEAKGLSPAAAAALATIVTQGPITLGELAVAEQVSPSTITRVVRGLERRGLVERVIDPTDRRVHRVRMTRRARRAIEVYRSKRNVWLAEQLRLGDDGALARLAVTVEVLEALGASAGPDPVSHDFDAAPPTGTRKRR
ncbi:MAG TPA: MarR family transcriptional regulator [Acidimicrobiales bacterium]